MKTVPHYVRVPPTERLPDVRTLAPFKAVIVIGAPYPYEWQEEVSTWLVENGCRYMMAWGPDCSSWDDSVDRADIKARNYEDDDQKFVMTTWHDDESLESVFWYSQFCGIFSCDEIELINAVILDISHEDRSAELLELFEQSKTLAEREQD